MKHQTDPLVNGGVAGAGGHPHLVEVVADWLGHVDGGIGVTAQDGPDGGSERERERERERENRKCVKQQRRHQKKETPHKMQEIASCDVWKREADAMMKCTVTGRVKKRRVMFFPLCKVFKLGSTDQQRSLSGVSAVTSKTRRIINFVFCWSDEKRF